ncbi:MAG: 4'-phosphopantetheinyl transferase superfamily protein [Treponema sp.]|jgi:phosphopantetheine--protein transferase-like protein|nr:4'-phosphopantetheinyl transferase superfamily protein [Treponema sp.]
MKVTTGTDIVKIERLFPASSPLNLDDPFVKRAFSEGEQKQGKGREGEQALKAYFAARFAGKEAVFKALSVCGCGFAPQDIEVIDGASGRPEVTLSGQTREALDRFLDEYAEFLLSLDVSLSFEDEYAVAMAVAVFEKRS